MLKKRKKPKGSGRPPVNIDWDKVNFYLQAGCDGASIARLLGYYPDTLYAQVQRKFKMDFTAYAETKKREGVAMMEGTIFKDAIEHGGVDRMFWLKNRAKWADKQEISGPGGGAIGFTIELIDHSSKVDNAEDTSGE